MVVDDDDVAFHRPAMHFGDETLVPGAAFLTDASVGARVDLMPERAGLGQFGEFGAISGLCRLFPRDDSAIVLDLFQTTQHGLAGKVVKLFSAKIITSALHVTNV